ncbi:MBL fold metallo-hydrolase [Pseudorhodoplanes sp.]|uniref:MBL fold metallo-hydrolase n=1 Tax=Pseudorhodoplanes sp. TaxID=1934341 RepID=UPI002C1F9008|nr:MBL fold metallo-hydrolase [Pseudorhodoplanes sp.]HWV53148.1 MBL fold metallo-hydrolase [Pseudorhodoplanes sp.]
MAMNALSEPRSTPSTSGSPDVTGFYHEKTGSIVYLVVDPATRHAAIIDPVLDFDPRSGRVTTASADAILKVIAERGLTIDWILDTHPHADHFSAAAYLKEKLGAPTAIGAKVADIQKLWEKIYNLPPYSTQYWDRLFADGDTFRIGSLDARVILCAGHTLASVTYVVGDAAFVHDTLFQPDSGTARCDFPGGSASTLYDSIQRILALPDATRLFTGHDYRPNGRPAQWESTVAQQKRDNTHVGGGRDRTSYVAMREARDKTLPLPELMLAALQVNLRGGRLPDPEDNGRSYLKIPFNAF